MKRYSNNVKVQCFCICVFIDVFGNRGRIVRMCEWDTVCVCIHSRWYGIPPPHWHFTIPAAEGSGEEWGDAFSVKTKMPLCQETGTVEKWELWQQTNITERRWRKKYEWRWSERKRRKGDRHVVRRDFHCRYSLLRQFVLKFELNSIRLPQMHQYQCIRNAINKNV